MQKVLLVDDNRELRELLGQWLQQWSFAPTTADSLKEAKSAVLAEGPFKVVICDFDLPDGNGLELFAWLRCEREDPAGFLLISGSASLLRYKALDFLFLPKPFRPEDLRHRLEELMGAKADTR